MSGVDTLAFSLDRPAWYPGAISIRPETPTTISKSSMHHSDDIELCGTQQAGMDDKEPDEDVTEYQPIVWKRLFLGWKHLSFWILCILILIATILISLKHDQVVETLRPFSQQVRDLPAGWLIPILILFVISFPPLFGHEIIALLCGLVYGLWIGFAIVSAGTFFGEIGTWFAFKYALRKKAAKLQRTNLNFAALVRLTVEGGFWIVLLIRFSAIPSHFSTAVFSTCDVKFWHFTVATFLSLPKQLFIVYLGVLLVDNGDTGSAKNIIYGIAFAVTFVMAGYIYWKLKAHKASLLEIQIKRMARRAEVRRVKEMPDEGCNKQLGQDDECGQGRCAT